MPVATSDNRTSKQACSAGVVDITPQTARELLERNTRNRKVAKTRVDTFADDIASGRWQMNGEPIIVASDGTLMDGQHRLLACVKANRPFQTMLVRGVNPSAFMTLDQGAKRSLGDVLGLEGQKNSEVLAAALRLAVWAHADPPYANRGFAFGSKSVGDLVNKLPAHPMLAASVQFAIEHKAPKLCPPAIVALGHYMGLRYGARHGAGDFYDAVTSGVNLDAGDPALILRNWLIRREGTMYGYQARATIVFALMRCWNAHCTGRQIERVWIGGDRTNMRSAPGFYGDACYREQGGMIVE